VRRSAVTAAVTAAIAQIHDPDDQEDRHQMRKMI
jgi:hypothetical protein